MTTMKNLKNLLAVSAAVILIGGASHAADNQGIFQMLSTMNEIKADQNPDFESSEDMLKSRVLDNRSRVIGKVEDIVVRDNGAVAMLEVDFNKMRMDKAMVDFGKSGAKKTSSGYSLNYQSSQMEDAMPEMLANIETASGEAADTYSVKSLIGAMIVDSEGKQVGKVKDILFNGRGSQAQAFLVDMKFGAKRGQNLALPFGLAEIRALSDKQELMLDEASLTALQELVKTL